VSVAGDKLFYANGAEAFHGDQRIVPLGTAVASLMCAPGRVCEKRAIADLQGSKQPLRK
jgi:hypothetical protein